MKKIVIGISSLFIIIIFAIIGLLYFLPSIITPEFIVKQMETSMNLRADIKKVNINILSILSAVELEGLHIYNRDKYADNAISLKERDTVSNPLISLKKVDLKLGFLSLLQRKIELKNFLIIDPEISVVLYANGANNLSHLFQKPKTVGGIANPSLDNSNIPKIETDTKNTDEKKDQPFSVKTLPVSANLKKIGIQNGYISIFVENTSQRIFLKNVNLILDEIDIDPLDLNKHNSIKLISNINIAISNLEGKERALLKINSNGIIIPFIRDTGLINPLVDYNIRILKGSYFESLSIMDSLSGGLPILANAGLKFDALDKRAEISDDISAQVSYSNGRVTVKNETRIPTLNYDLNIEKNAWINIRTNEHGVNGSALVSKSESDKAIDKLDAFIKTQTKTENPSELRNKILGNLIKDNRINLPFSSSGDIKSPNVKLNVELPSIVDLAKGMIAGKIKEEIGKKINKEAKDLIDKKAPKEAKDLINNSIKKLF